MEKELIEFLKYIKEVHVDSYGHLEICDSGDELDPTVERVVKEYMKLKNKQSGGVIGVRIVKEDYRFKSYPDYTVRFITEQYVQYDEKQGDTLYGTSDRETLYPV